MFASSLSDCRLFPSLKSKIKRIIPILFCHTVVRVDTNDSLCCIRKGKCTEYIVSHAKTGVNDNIICRVCLNQIYLNKQLAICEILLVHSDT